MNKINVSLLSGEEFYKFYKIIPDLLKHASRYYPDFDNWLESKVMPDVFSKTRYVFVARDNNTPVGLAICKKTLFENKLCTLWVDSDYQKHGIGTTLIKTSLFILESSPIITIPEFKLYEFNSIIKNMNFVRLGEQKNLYQSGVNEVIFNIPAR